MKVIQFVGFFVAFCILSVYAQETNNHVYSPAGPGQIQEFQVPTGVYSLSIMVWGAGGSTACASDLNGGYVQGSLAVSPGETIRFVIGISGACSHDTTTVFQQLTSSEWVSLVSAGGSGAVNTIGNIINPNSIRGNQPWSDMIASGATAIGSEGMFNQNGLLSIQYDSLCEAPPGATEAGFAPELDIPRSGLFVLNNIPTLSIVLLDIPNFYTPEFTFPACTTNPIKTPDVTNCSATFQVDMPNYNQDCTFELTEADSKFTLTGILSVSINWNYTDPFFQITELRTYSFPLEWFVELDQTVTATSALCVPHEDITSEVLPSVAVCHYMASKTIETDCLSNPDDPESPLVTYIGCDCSCPSSSGEFCEVPSPTVECASRTLELIIDAADESACSKVNHKLPLVLLSVLADESSLGSACSYSSCPFPLTGDQAIGLRRTITGATTAEVMDVPYPDLAILDIDFSIGVSTVTYDIVDLNGKTESFSIDITVKDEVPCCCDISPPSTPTEEWSLNVNLNLESKCELGMYGTRNWADWGTFKAKDNYANDGQAFDLQLFSVIRPSTSLSYSVSEAPDLSGVYTLNYIGLQSTASECICTVDLYYHKEALEISGNHGVDYEQPMDRAQDGACDTSNFTTYNAEYSCPAPGAVDGKSVTVGMSTYSTGPLQLQVTNDNTPHSFPLICTDCLGGELLATDYVTVVDQSCPCVVCSAINVIQDCASSGYDCSVDVDLAEHCTAIDNFDGDITSTGFGSPRSVEMSVTSLRVDVVDAQGNTCGIDAPITVTETCIPHTGCPDDIIIHVEPFNQNCEGTPAFSHSTYSTEDNCDSNPITTNSYDFEAMYSLSSSPHEFTYTSTDASGNTGTCVTTVTLRDEHGPWILLGSGDRKTSGSLEAINVELGSQCNTPTVAYDLSLDFEDNCATFISVEYTINSNAPCQNGGPEQVVNQFIVKNGDENLSLEMDVRLSPYTISIKASDTNGNDNTWSQVINIVDMTPSVITVESQSRSRLIQTDACKDYATKSHQDVLSDFSISICDNSNTEITSITRSPEDVSNPTHHHVGTTVVYTISVVDCRGLSSTETVEYIVTINCGDECVGELENCEPIFNGDNEPVLCDPITCTCASSYTPEQGCGPDGSPATTGVCQGPATIPGCTVTVDATTAPSVQAIIHMDQIYSTTAFTRTTNEFSPIDYVDYYLEFKALTVTGSETCVVEPQSLALEDYLSFTSCCDETCDKDMQAFVYNVDASLIETTVDHCNRIYEQINHQVSYNVQTKCYTFPVCVTNTPIVVGRRVNETDFICRTPASTQGSVECPVLGTTIKASVCGADHAQTFDSYPCVVDFLWNDDAVFELDQGFSYQFGLSNENPLVMGLTGTINNVDSVFNAGYDVTNKLLSHSFPKGQSEVAYKFSNCLNNYHQCPVTVTVIDGCPPLTNIWAVANFVVPDIPSSCYTDGVPCGHASSEGSYRTGCTVDGCEGLNTFECEDVFVGPCTFVVPADSLSNSVSFDVSAHLPCFKDNCDSQVDPTFVGDSPTVLTFDTTTSFSFTSRDISDNVGSFSYKVKVADYTKPTLAPKGDLIDVCAATDTTFFNIALDSEFQSSYEASDNVNTQAELLWEFIPTAGAYPITCNDDTPSRQEVIVSDLSYNSVSDEFSVRVRDCQPPVITKPTINSNCLSEPRIVQINQVDPVTFSISILRKVDLVLKSEIQYVTVADNDLTHLNFIVKDSLDNLLTLPFEMDLSCDIPITFTFVATDCHNTVSETVSVVGSCASCMPTCSFTAAALDFYTSNCLCCALLEQEEIDNGVSGRNGNNEQLVPQRTTSEGTCFGLGVTTVNYKVTDLSGNEGFCDYTVTVTDQEQPRTENSCTTGARDCPVPKFVLANDAFCVTDANVCNYSPDYPIYGDNCGAPTHSRWATDKSEATVFDPTAALPSATLTCGLNTFSFEAKDPSENVSPECSYSVTVEPDTPFVCSGQDPFQNINNGLCSESCPACTIDDQVHTIPATSSAEECVAGVSVDVNLYAYAYCGGVTTLSARYMPGQENSGVPNSVAPQSLLSGLPESCSGFTVGEDYERNSAATFTEGTNPLGSIQEQWSFPYSATPYTVRYSATGTGEYPKEKSGSFKVTILDEVAPTIVTCSSAAPVRVCAYGGVSARATFSAPELFDNTCHPTLFTYTANGNAVHSMDTLFPVGTTQVTMTAIDFAGNTNTCSFDVVVQPPFPEAKSSAVLTRVYISKENATHYKAQLKIATYVTNPHRVFLQDGASSVNELSAEEGQPTGCDSSNSDGSTTCKQIWDADYYIFGCVLPSTNLVLKTSIDNVQSCDSVDSSSSCGLDIMSGLTTSHEYTPRPNNLNIVLNANNFCAKELSKVRLVAYIRTVSQPDYTGFLSGADALTPGASITFPDSITTAVPQSTLSSLVIINQTAVGALVKTVTLQKFEKVYFNDQARSVINTTLLIVDNAVKQGQYDSDNDFSIEGYAQFAVLQHKELLVTSFPQPTFYVTLKATVSVTYLLGATSRRRLLSLVQKDIKQGEQTTAASRRRVSYLEEKTASAVANHVALSLDSVPTTAFSDGGSGLALVVIRLSSSMTESAVLAAAVVNAVVNALSMPAKSVEAYVVPNSQSGSTSLVQLVYKQTLSTITLSGSQFASSVQKQLSSSSSALSSSLTSAMITTDPDFFYVGVVKTAAIPATSTSTTSSPTTTVISTDGSSGFSSSSVIIIAVIAAGVVACIAATIYAVRVRSAHNARAQHVVTFHNAAAPHSHGSFASKPSADVFDETGFAPESAFSDNTGGFDFSEGVASF